jgi:hypothetical protein
VNVKVYVVSQKVAQAEFKHRTSFGSRSRSDRGYSGAASLSLIVPVAEAVPEAIVKVSLVLQ